MKLRPSLNIVGLPKYMDEIRMSQLFKSFDIIAFNETWLDLSISDGEVKIYGYDLIRKDRTRKGGGVCIFLRSSINYQNRSDLVPNDLEGVCLKIPMSLLGIERQKKLKKFAILTRKPRSQLEY